MLLVQTIKNQTAEKKAMRDLDDQIEEFDRRPQTPKSRLSVDQNQFRKTFGSTFMSGFGSRGNRSNRSGSRESNRSKAPADQAMRETTLSFFKEVFVGDTTSKR